MATYVLVHGICHGTWCWQPTIDALTARGPRAVAVDLPLTSLGDDAAAVTALLDAQDEPVILAGHSYGGVVISRAAAGRDDIAHLVYVAAVMAAGDEVFFEVAAAYPPSPLAEQATFTEDGQIIVGAEAAVDCFYRRCDPAAAQDAASRLRPTAAACLGEATGAEPWTTVPSTYILCTEDRAIQPELQRVMSARAGRVITYDTDHSPFMSAAEQFIDDLDSIATS